MLYHKVKECIPFLMDVLYRGFTTYETMLVLEWSIDITEVLTALEIIIGMGSQQAVAFFLAHPRSDIVLQGLVKLM